MLRVLEVVHDCFCWCDGVTIMYFRSCTTISGISLLYLNSFQVTQCISYKFHNDNAVLCWSDCFVLDSSSSINSSPQGSQRRAPAALCGDASGTAVQRKCLA